MARGPMNERVAVLEEKIDRIAKDVSDHNEISTSKLDKIIEGQADGKKHRETMEHKLDLLDKRIAKMEPHVEMIADARKWGSISAKVAATGIAVSTAAWGAYLWLKTQMFAPHS